MRRLFVAVAVISLAMTAACHRQSTAASFTADISIKSTVMPGMSGRLYLRGKHLRADWGQFADVVDLQQRNGRRIIATERAYQELGDKDLSTYAPEMTNGSPCPHAEVPAACKLLGTEVIDVRRAKKWDAYNPKGFHVYFWTDDVLEITLRMAIGDAAQYEVRNLRERSVTDSMFELPAGYERLDRPFKP